MHNKFCIIDERIVVTGSYNWSGNAARHYENIVVIEDNFSLVKSYLHEFHDLLELDSGQDKIRCSVCSSTTFNVIVLGDELGLYAESQVTLWSICSRNFHVQPLGFTYENHLAAQLGLNDEDEFPDDFEIQDRDSMLYCFKHERTRIMKLQQYFSWRKVTNASGITYDVKPHAVGKVYMANFNEFNKGYANEEEWVLGIGWRDRWMRRQIPKILEAHEGMIGVIIDSQRGHGSALWKNF